MREIKFNAVDEDTGDYIVYNDWLNTDGYEAGETPNEYLSAFLEFYFGYKLLQYTGLKDSSGIEIYEHMELDDNFEVSFKNGCYILTNISNGDIILLYNYWRDKNGQIEITKEYTKI